MLGFEFEFERHPSGAFSSDVPQFRGLSPTAKLLRRFAAENSATSKRASEGLEIRDPRLRVGLVWMTPDFFVLSVRSGIRVRGNSVTDDSAGPAASRPQLLVLGDWDRAEMATVRDWLRAVEPFANVRHQHRLPDSSQGALPDDSSPDMVIVCQSWPDEFSASDVSTSLGRWPLALWVCCFGSWCESDGRTRTIWPIGIRVPARAAVSRLTQLWEIVAHRRNELLPLTASRDEAFEFDTSLRNAAARMRNTLRGQAVSIRSPDPALRQWLSDLVATLGAVASVQAD